MSAKQALINAEALALSGRLLLLAVIGSKRHIVYQINYYLLFKIMSKAE